MSNLEATFQTTEPGADPVKNPSLEFDFTLEYWPIKEAKNGHVTYFKLCEWSNYNVESNFTLNLLKAYILGGANIPIEKSFFDQIGFNFPFLNFTNVNFVEVFDGQKFSMVSSELLPNQPGGVMVKTLAYLEH